MTPFVDDGDDVLFRAFARQAVFLGEAFDGGVLLVLGQIGFADFLKVEGDLVFAEVAGERDAVAVGDLAADSRFADGDGAVAGDLIEEFIAALDLELMQARQQRAKADEHECRQQVESESVAGFHGIRWCAGAGGLLPG